MRILVLCKRQYTGRDLLDDRYGRLYCLPSGLAALGHQVAVATTSYRPRPLVHRLEDGVDWSSVGAVRGPAAILAHWRQAAIALRPDLVMASSDAAHVAAGEWFARQLGVPAVLDFYDDYEAFGLTRVPGLRPAMRRAARRAACVISVSQTLASKLPSRGVDPARIRIVQNGVPEGFVPNSDRNAARVQLGLPVDAPLIGTAGALSFGRGINDLFHAFKRVQEQRPEARLVLAGPRGRGVDAAMPPGSIDLGQLQHARVGLLFRALDVGVVCNQDNDFAQACFPMKLAEMAACGLPVVAADVGEVSHLLADRADSRFRPGDWGELAQRLLAQLGVLRPPDADIAQNWGQLARALENAILDNLHGQQGIGRHAKRIHVVARGRQ